MNPNDKPNLTHPAETYRQQILKAAEALVQLEKDLNYLDASVAPEEFFKEADRRAREAKCVLDGIRDRAYLGLKAVRS